jgi:hypothetical protein
VCSILIVSSCFGGLTPTKILFSAQTASDEAVRAPIAPRRQILSQQQDSYNPHQQISGSHMARVGGARSRRRSNWTSAFAVADSQRDFRGEGIYVSQSLYYYTHTHTHKRSSRRD